MCYTCIVCINLGDTRNVGRLKLYPNNNATVIRDAPQKGVPIKYIEVIIIL